MHVLTWLLERSALTPAQYEAAYHQAQRTGERIEEAVIDTGALSEGELLKLLAARYQTRFVSTERLARSQITRSVLQLIPHKLAERLQTVPIVFDKASSVLSIVVAAPGEEDVEKQVQVVSGVRQVRAYIARPRAIAAAIEKFYLGNPSSFMHIVRRDTPSRDTHNPFEPSSSARSEGSDEFADPFAGLVESDEHTPSSFGVTAPPPPAPMMSPPIASPPVRKHGFVGDAAPVPIDGTIPAGTIPADVAVAPTGVAHDDYLETLNVFVSLLETERGALRGHSGTVARLCRMIADRAEMASKDRHALLVAAYLHDIGKASGNYHLTALNVARYEGHRNQAQKTRLTPIKLFESSSLPDETRRILSHMYERWDGQGFPDRLSGKDIAFGARVLAMVETYADLTANERNPYRRVLPAGQALSVIKDLGGQLFDPALADLLLHLATRDRDGPKSDLAGRPRALLVDPDAEETTVLELRMIEHGFAVEIARDFGAACEKMVTPPDVIVTEIDLGAGTEGFSLLERVQTIERGKRPAVIVFTAKSDRDSVSKGFELGATDYLVKPASAELVATKAGQALEESVRRRSDGVRGSLKEMSLPDVVQVLANGRRTGRLMLVAGARRGEIHFCEGAIWDAKFGAAHGEQAIYDMLRLSDGTFALDPSFKPDQRTIEVSPEGLLLEGMRRLDEGI